MKAKDPLALKVVDHLEGLVDHIEDVRQEVAEQMDKKDGFHLDGRAVGAEEMNMAREAYEGGCPSFDRQMMFDGWYTPEGIEKIKVMVRTATEFLMKAGVSPRHPIDKEVSDFVWNEVELEPHH